MFTKQEYAIYLKSDTWLQIRRQVLRRDRHKCRACGGRAYVVHHREYPEVLGEEDLNCLFSLCEPCHSSIHKAEKKMGLKQATDFIINSEKPLVIKIKQGVVWKRKRKTKKKNKKKLVVDAEKKKWDKENERKKNELVEWNEKLRESFRKNKKRGRIKYRKCLICKSLFRGKNYQAGGGWYCSELCKKKKKR